MNSPATPAPRTPIRATRRRDRRVARSCPRRRRSDSPVTTTCPLESGRQRRGSRPPANRPSGDARRRDVSESSRRCVDVDRSSKPSLHHDLVQSASSDPIEPAVSDPDVGRRTPGASQQAAEPAGSAAESSAARSASRRSWSSSRSKRKSRSASVLTPATMMLTTATRPCWSRPAARSGTAAARRRAAARPVAALSRQA